ncbi:Fe-S cluster assembly protein SufD [Cognatiluteimonas weifangensis]|uniref:Fe-S cluster assembly protein SufD n=1 Tax=Cognatiluteimonas weifangensis TaxID=2303539 RepID=A0A372DS52_9GAMM|nr:Fe-S cluster assembly protein SufD [Luteimonas weifangensis]RFP62408.1 Fe-S cluster assembly protein SufD [Luteimonas weifangensis]
MGALLDSLAAGFDGDAGRRLALDAALRDGLPPTRSEAWKYTPLRALERRSFSALPQPHAAVDPALLAAIPAPRMVLVNGRFDPELSDLSGLPAGATLRPLAQVLADPDPRAGNFLQRRFERADEVFARLNAAFAVDGAVLRVAEHVRLPAPLQLVFVGAAADADLAWHARHFIELRRGAEATVVEHHLAAGAHAHLGNTLTHVHLAAGAQLQHLRLQDEAPRATLMARTDAVLAREAQYQRLDLELGAALSRHELNVRLEGENAMLVCNGVLLASDKRHLDTRLHIEHIARDTACDLTWRGLGAGRGRAVFHGGIVIRPGADGSDANLSNKNLLLSDQAEIDTQPVLEIYADEVKAAHGATVGQLDPTAMFYLRSRGLPESEARRLLTAAFCREVLAVLEPATLRETLTASLDRALAALAPA